MKIFLVLVTLLATFNKGDKVTDRILDSRITTTSTQMENIEDALRFRDDAYFCKTDYFYNSKILAINIYEVWLSTDTWKIKSCELVEGKY